MGSPSELSLEYKPSNYLSMQKQQGGQPAEQTQKIQEFLARLEEERFKIDAFKRELPLCMQLLNNAVEAYRQQLDAYQTNQGPQPVLEEFIPLKNVDGSDKTTSVPSEKASWMISAQLWSPANDAAKQSPGTPVTPPAKDVADHGFDVVASPKLTLDAKQRNGGAFLPFSKEKNKGIVAGKGLPEAAAFASSPDKVVGEKKCIEVIEINGSNGRRENNTIKGSGGGEQGGKGGGGSQSDQGQAQAPQPHRKARRCWSPDLHRRFVNALQILGGSLVATPKQIRELMKVDGLTNDEVKSHLQKYRLHTRRPIPAPPAPVPAPAPQLVVLGGIWVPPEYATSAAGPAAIYGTPAPAHYCTAAAAAMPQEYYPPPLQAHHPRHHHIHRPSLRRSGPVPGGGYKGRVPSPDQSEGKSGAEQSESIEEDERQEGEEREDEEETEEDEDEEDEAADKTKAAAGDEKALVPLVPAKADDGGHKF